MKFVAILGLASFTALSGLAGTITFDSLGSALTTYTEQGVTFTPVGGGTFGGVIDPNGTLGILADGSPRQTMRADISGGASSVSVDLGDFNSDPDGLFLEVYSLANVLLASSSLNISADDSVMHTLSASAAGIAYAVMGSRAPSINGSSVYIDNFTWDSGNGARVPEPSTIILMGAGLAAFWVRRRSLSRR